MFLGIWTDGDPNQEQIVQKLCFSIKFWISKFFFKKGNPQHPSTHRLPPLHQTAVVPQPKALGTRVNVCPARRPGQSALGVCRNHMSAIALVGPHLRAENKQRRPILLGPHTVSVFFPRGPWMPDH